MTSSLLNKVWGRSSITIITASLLWLPDTPLPQCSTDRIDLIHIDIQNHRIHRLYTHTGTALSFREKSLIKNNISGSQR